MFEEEDGIVVADGRFEQRFGVGWCGRGHDLETGDVEEPADRVLGMDCPEPAAGANRGADDERDRRLFVGEVEELRRLIDEAVHGQGQEVPEHDLDDRSEAAHRASESGAGQCELRDRRVEDPAVAMPVTQTGCGGEDAAGSGDVLPEEDDAVVASQLLIERVANGVAEVELWHQASESMSRRPLGSSRAWRTSRRKAAASAP